MADIITEIHSMVRWLLVILFVVSIARSSIGWLKKKEWLPLDNTLSLILNMAADVQLVLGLVLYFVLSPTTAVILSGFNKALATPGFSFIGIFHPLAMFLAVVLMHIGGKRAQRQLTGTSRHKGTVVTLVISFILILMAIPWNIK